MFFDDLVELDIDISTLSEQGLDEFKMKLKQYAPSIEWIILYETYDGTTEPILYPILKVHEDQLEEAEIILKHISNLDDE